MPYSSNYAVRAVTPVEASALRSRYATRWNMVIIDPPEVFSARVATPPASFDDGFTEIVYTDGAGQLSSVAAEMELWIGSSAGACDIGVTRVRSATAGMLCINPCSVKINTGDYLSVRANFSIWQRAFTGGMADVGIPYSATAGTCVPRIAPIVCVLRLVDGAAVYAPPPPTDSWCYDGAEIVAYRYECAGADVQNGDTSSPTITFTAPGQYLLRVTLTDDRNRATTAYRWIIVEPPLIDFAITRNPVGDFSSGDWTFDAVLLNPSDFSRIRHRALIALYADDYYDGGHVSIGRVAGYENIVCVGWVDGESISRDADKSQLSFTVHGAAWWLSKLSAYPLELRSAGVPAAWGELSALTLPAAIGFMARWATNLYAVMDVYTDPADDVVINDTPLQSGGGVMAQMSALCAKRGAAFLCNSLGQAYVEIDQQIRADQSSAVAVMDITDADWTGEITVMRNASKISMLELQAIESGSGMALYSRAPSNVGSDIGRCATAGEMIVENQDDCNRIAGMIYAAQNAEYELIDVTLAQNNRMFDVAPRMTAWLTVSLPRVSIDGARAIPRRVELIYGANGTSQTRIGFEIETSGEDGVTYVPPSGDINDNPEPPDVAGVDFPTGDLFPSVVPSDELPDCASYTHNLYSTTFENPNLRGDDPNKLIARSYFPCSIRPASMGGSYLRLRATIYGDASGKLSVYGVQNGARVISASSVSWNVIGEGFAKTASVVAIFAPTAVTPVSGFEIELQSGVGTEIYYAVVSTHATGTFDANNEQGGGVHNITAGNWYAIENVGGPWQGDQTSNPAMQYKFMFRWDDTPLWSHWWGYAQESGGSPYYLELGTLTYELPGGYVIRVFYQATSDTVVVRAGSDTWSDNSGSMGYIISNVERRGRGVDIRSGLVGNVCGANG